MVHPVAAAKRPPLDTSLTGEEFDRFYWLKSELVTFARSQGIGASGSKREIEERIKIYLSQGRVIKSDSPLRVDELRGPLSGEMQVPANQKMTAHVRDYMTGRCGDNFRFDAHMRRFFKEGNKTLDQAVEHWFQTRDSDPQPIAEQFEYNRFVRQFYQDNPRASQKDMTKAWAEWRAI